VEEGRERGSMTLKGFEGRVEVGGRGAPCEGD